MPRKRPGPAGGQRPRTATAPLGRLCSRVRPGVSLSTRPRNGNTRARGFLATRPRSRVGRNRPAKNPPPKAPDQSCFAGRLLAPGPDLDAARNGGGACKGGGLGGLAEKAQEGGGKISPLCQSSWSRHKTQGGPAVRLPRRSPRFRGWGAGVQTAPPFPGCKRRELCEKPGEAALP